MAPPSSRVIRIDAGGLRCDAVTIDALARLQFAARRLGHRVRIEDPPPQMLELIAFMGLREVLADER